MNNESTSKSPIEAQALQAHMGQGLSKPVDFGPSMERLKTGKGGLMAAYDWATTMPSLLISLTAHIVFVVIAAFVIVASGAAGPGNDLISSGHVEMAVISEGELAKLEGAIGESGLMPAIPDLPTEESTIEPIVTTESSIGDETARGAMEISDLGSLSGGGDISGGTGLGLGGSGGGGGGASFFGVEASGTRFAYLVDVSASMDNKRISMLRDQLNKSITGLAPNCSFFVVAFSSQPQVMGDKREWRDSSEGGKKWARTLIEMLAASGGTEPMNGFEIIFSMRPRPDAIYFMTDGEFSEVVVERVVALNKQLRIPIHCICFGQESGGMLMRSIAKESKGTYRFVPE